MDKKIYTISRFRKNPFEKEEDFVKGDTVGFYFDHQKAIDRVQKNTCDLNEAGYYPFVIVEEYGEGIHNESWEFTFFEYVRETDSYVKKEINKDKHPLTNFAMG